jgi:hypothetical protein
MGCQVIHNVTVSLTLVLLVGCALPPGQQSQNRQLPEQTFWDWFRANESRLFDFEKDRHAIFDELTAQLQKVHEGLTFEFGPKVNETREFVISADGIKDVFPAVIALADAAPSLTRWKIIKFRPRRQLMPINSNGLQFKPDQIEFTIEPDGDKLGITLFMVGYKETEHERYASIGFLMLDEALGEYDVETKVGGIDFKSSQDSSRLPKQPIVRLTERFDEMVRSKPK